jgi:hypothetical protein
MDKTVHVICAWVSAVRSGLSGPTWAGDAPAAVARAAPADVAGNYELVKRRRNSSAPFASLRAVMRAGLLATQSR